MVAVTQISSLGSDLTSGKSVTRTAKILSKNHSSQKGNCNLKTKEQGGDGGGEGQTLPSSLVTTLK